MESNRNWSYVYRLQGISPPAFGYTGLTSNLHRRLLQHNRGDHPSTATHAPFRIAFAAAFPDKQRALAFEAYLKSGSGHAFARNGSGKRGAGIPFPSSGVFGMRVILKARWRETGMGQNFRTSPTLKRW